MNAEHMIDKIKNSQFVSENLPINMQLGIPYLKNKDNSLYLSFSPHKETLSDRMLFISERQYILELLYPSGRIMKFSDLLYEEVISDIGIVTSFDMDWFRNNGIYKYKSAFALCTDVLDFYDRYGFVTDAVINSYRRDFVRIVKQLGLSGLYEVDE